MVQLDRKERVKALLDNVGRSLKERDLPVSAAYVIHMSYRRYQKGFWKQRTNAVSAEKS